MIVQSFIAYQDTKRPQSAILYLVKANLITITITTLKIFLEQISSQNSNSDNFHDFDTTMFIKYTNLASWTLILRHSLSISFHDFFYTESKHQSILKLVQPCTHISKVKIGLPEFLIITVY